MRKLLEMKEMRIKVTLRNHFSPIRLEKTKFTNKLPRAPSVVLNRTGQIDSLVSFQLHREFHHYE